MVKNCKYFKCFFHECEGGDPLCGQHFPCSGRGSEGQHNCGCDVCVEKHMEGGVEICEVGLFTRESEMEEETI